MDLIVKTICFRLQKQMNAAKRINKYRRTILLYKKIIKMPKASIANDNNTILVVEKNRVIPNFLLIIFCI